MQFGINLLVGQKKLPVERKAIFQKLKLLGGAILLVYTIFIGVLFVFSFYLSSGEKKLKQETSQIETKIKSFQKKESLEITLKGRIEEATKILEAKERTRQVGASQEQLLSRAQDLILPGVSLQTIEVAAGELVFSGQASNFQVLGDFLEQLNKPESGWFWIHLDSLARSANGIYSFSLKTQP